MVIRMKWTSLALVWGSVVSFASAEYYFTVPDGHQEDFSQHFFIGQTLPVTWNAISSNYTADLWITHFTSDDFTRKLASKYIFSPPVLHELILTRFSLTSQPCHYLSRLLGLDHRPKCHPRDSRTPLRLPAASTKCL
jgi:hypothetical protein